MQGKKINGFTLTRPLGKGGMAEVWYAENEIHKPAAVKMMLPKLCDDETALARFKNEAEVMVPLDHPNIRQVYDYGSIDGRPAIVMQYLEGNDLKGKMKAGELFSEGQLEKWWNQLVDALGYTHGRGIVHRDIKPSNIFIDKSDNVKLLDFGIAKVEDNTVGTLTGSNLGTRIYMSPEQVKDPKRVDRRSDIYSLAVTFVHLLTGEAPYNVTTTSDYDIQTSIVTTPLDLGGVPEEWKAFLEPYLAKDRSKRPALRHVAFGERKDDGDDETVYEEATEPSGDGTVLRVEEKPQKGEEPKKEKKPKGNLWMALGAAAFILVAILVVQHNKRVETEGRYMAAIGRGSAQYDSGNYAEARAIFVEASSIPGVNTAEADNWIDKCDARIRERAEAERKAKEEADMKAKAEAERKAREEADMKAKAEAERKAREEAVRRAKAKGGLPGVFSVSATTKVQFSKGNLTYNRRTKEWAFYEHQYDRASGYDENLISLFTWGYGDWSSDPGTESYGSTFTDWGTRMGDGRTWRTLSEDEWEYLIEKRTTSSGIRYAKAEVNGVAGLVVVPDDWSASTYALSKTNNVDADFTANVISRNTWNDKLEPAGCVFLPCAGYRDGTTVYNVGSRGRYWSSTASSAPYAYGLHFASGGVHPAGHYNRYYGRSVRLVCFRR